MRRLAVLVAIAAAGAVAAAPAGATNECHGLQVCVPVAGPWVVATPGRVEFQLACPRRFVVAGLDAELSSRGIEVGFVGKLGSPVNPGITTSTSALFLGRLVRGGNAAASFRPHIGCIPSSGGGQRAPTAYHPFPPGTPSVRRVVELHVRAGTARASARCARGERLVGATHALGFYGATPPALALVRAVRVTQRVRNATATLTVRAGEAAVGAGGIVQLDLVCATR